MALYRKWLYGFNLLVVLIYTPYIFSALHFRIYNVFSVMLKHPKAVSLTQRIPVACLNASRRGGRTIPRTVVLKASINVIWCSIVYTDLIELREWKILHNLTCRSAVPAPVNTTVSGKKHNVRMHVRKYHIMNITVHVSKRFKGFTSIF